MSNKLAWLVGIVVGVPVTVVAAGAILVNTIDQQALLNELSGVVKTETQRDLKFNGPVNLKWFPSIGAELSGVTLSEYQSDKSFLNAERVNVSLALMPLLRSNVVVDAVEAEGVTVNVVKDEKGNFNFDDLAKGKAEGAEKPQTKTEQPGGQNLDFSVQSLALSNMNLVFQDMQQGMQAELRNFSLKSGSIQPEKPTRLQLTGQVLANKPKADIQVNLDTGLEFGLGEKMYAKLAKLDLGVQGQVDGQKADVSVTAKTLDFNAKTMALELADLLAKVDAALPEVGKVNLAVAAPSVSLTETAAKGESLSVKANLTQPNGQSVNASLDLSQLAGNLQKSVTGNLALKVDVDQSPRVINLNLASPLAVDVAGQKVKLASLAGNLDVKDAALPKGQTSMPLKGSVALDNKAQQAALELASSFESTKFDLKAGVNDFAKPFITAVFNADKLDVDALLPPAEKKTEGKKEEGGNIDDLPVDLSPLKSVNADAKLNVGYLRASGIVVQNIALHAVSKGGRLVVEPMTASLYEGTSKGRIVADASTNEMVIKQDLTNVLIEPLLKDVLNRDMAAGKGNVKIDLTTRGKTVGQLKANLNGKLGVALQDGAVKGFNLAETLRNAKNLFTGTASNTTTAADSTAQTDFTSMSVSFDVKDGVATSNDLSLMAPLFRIGGAGKIDLVKNSLDYTADAAIVATSTGQGGKTLDGGLNGLNVPVRLFGGFAAIQWEVLLKELAKAALKAKISPELDAKKAELKAKVDQEKAEAKAKVDEKKEELKAKAEEKLQDALKGFLKR